MPEKETLRRARKAKQEGKAPSTQAGAFVKEEIEHVRRCKHGARSAKQAIAIGLSKARRAGVKLSPPKKGKTSTATRKKAVAVSIANRCVVAVFQSSLPHSMESQSTRPVSAVAPAPGPLVRHRADGECEPPAGGGVVLRDAELAQHRSDGREGVGADGGVGQRWMNRVSG